WAGMSVMAPTLIVLLAVTIIVNVAQTGGLFTFKAMEPKGSKMNPISGLKKIISVKGLVELVKGFAKLFIVGIIGYQTVKNDVDSFMTLMISPIEYSTRETGSYVLMFVTRILAALFLLSIADAVYQRFQ